jgi:adenylate cyclase
MAIETEWKLLVTHLPALPNAPSKEMLQGYLDADGKPTVRVRIAAGKAKLNLKQSVADSRVEGAPQRSHEFEYDIPLDDAEQLLGMARARVAKRRYFLPSGIELDVFSGRHAGMVLAEFETPEDAPNAGPPPAPEGWEWRDVSSDVRFTNRWLASNGIPPGAELALPTG